MNDPTTAALALFQWPLDRTLLIEASAGTGKTWTITALYARQIVEAGIPVESLLVVTYTEAAAKELKRRIRARLVTLREALETGDSEDPFCRDMLALIGDADAAGHAIDTALSGFDQAAIHTIHGFCQRVLAEAAFESAAPFDAEVLTSERELRREICEDFWRTVVLDQPRLVVDALLGSGATPEKLGDRLGVGATRPWLAVVEPRQAREDLAAVEGDLDRVYRRARSLWLRHREEITRVLEQSDALNRNKYRIASIPMWVSDMDATLYDARPHLRRGAHFERFTNARLADSVRGGHPPPRHPFFDASSDLAAVDERVAAALEQRLAQLRAELRRYMLDNLAARKAARRWHSFDDLVTEVRRALDGPQGELLASRLRARYRAAMIDEFQDTDPEQLAIFKRVYGDGRYSRVFVGDPKQSIYSFRGADLFAYLAGRELAEVRRTLDCNYRSDPLLVAAVNALFGRVNHPFVFRELDYPEVVGDSRNAALLLENGAAGARLRFRFLRRDGLPGRNGVINKTAAAPAICVDVANAVGRLLARGGHGAVLLDGKPLCGGDIAVLVRTHMQARQVYDALTAAGVPSVRHGADSVFASREAEAVEQVLRAVAEPGDDRRLRAALVSDIIGLSAEELCSTVACAESHEAVIERFRRYHISWREHGFVSMLRALLVEHDVHSRILAREDGERAITNILHLSELIQERAHADGGSIDSLVKWVSERRADAGADSEEAELRLESDAERVQIVTMHRSKGLEYPVVFCPFLWDGSVRAGDDGEALFHDPDNGYRATVDLGSDLFDRHRELARREEFAEGIRLLYVALTRAGQRCVVHWGAIKDAGTSALAYLLHLASRCTGHWTIDELSEHLRGLDDDVLLADLESLRAVEPEAVGIEEVDPSAPLQPVALWSPPGESLAARAFERVLRSSWRVTSFSAIAGGAEEAPDRDEGAHEGMPAVESTEDRVVETVAAQTSIHRYPRGARTGLCWHGLLERLEFTAWEDGLHQSVMDELVRAGIDPAWAAATESMVRQVMTVDLDPPRGLRLCRVPRRSRIAELGFFYAVSDLRMDTLAALFAGADSPFAADYADALGRMHFEPVEGYVRGFIDLVFEHDGRYYVVDYKSNHLGPDAGSYEPELLRSAMARDGYFLQYLLYSVALHRYLRARLANYDCRTHFGGVYYLFLRGIDARGAARSGIFFDRPPPALIERLDATLGGSPNNGPRDDSTER